MSVKPLSFSKQDIGNLIKGTKQHFKWRLNLDGQMTTIEVLSSKLSGKRRVFRDGMMLVDR